MEVKVISRDTVTPSAPTPTHLRTFKLSLIDKIIAPDYTPFISFYPTKDFVRPDSTKLKNSLSETLTRFYPLAGRVCSDDLTIDCNDKGVLFLFSVALVNCSMTELVSQPPPETESFYRLAPPLPPLYPEPSDGAAQLAIQLNEFACGRVALGVVFFHRIIDATTMAAFLKCWAAMTNSKEAAMYPQYSATSIFPQGQQSLPTGLSLVMERSLMKEGKGIIKRFVFDGEAINTLKTKSTSQLVPNPTRVEALSAFIWKHCMAAATAVWGSQQPSMLGQVVNLRPRMAPPLSEYSVGNILWKAVAYCHAESAKEIQVDAMVGLLRNAVEKIREKFLLKVQSDGGFSAICECLEEVREKCCVKNLNPYVVTSWCNMGFNEVDFGWGKPIWVSQLGSTQVDSKYNNIVILMDGETNHKIEACIILDQREMTVLEGDQEFLAFASPNPPVLI